jgi:Spy/CpxP family protein refolding chaperone
MQEACLYPNGTVHSTSTTVVHTMKERRMNRSVGTIVVCAFVFTLACAPGGWAQQPQPPGGTPASQAPPPATDAQAREHAPRRLHWHGMRGHTSMRLQHDLARLTQQLKLSDEQRAQVQTLMRTHAKDVIRLKAEIQTMALDVLPLLEADPMDFAKVKHLVQTIAAKKADLRLAHITEMQDIRKLLTPEQQRQFLTMQSHLRGHGGMISPEARG